MSEPDADLLLHDAFDQFRQDVLPLVQAAEATVIVGTARARRRARLAAVAVAIVVVIAVPAVAFGARRAQPDVLPGPGPSTTAEPAPSATYEPTATPTPPPSPSGSPGGVPSTTAPPTGGELANARLPVDWSWGSAVSQSCTSGLVQFTGGAAQKWPNPPGQSVYKVARTDVDRDGQPDIVAELMCRYAEAAEKQVAAYRITGPGTYALLGVVTHTEPDTLDISEFSVDAEGGVQVRMADRYWCCGTPETWIVRQWRGFAWTGSGFSQTSGPTTFVADPAVADVRVTAPATVYGPVVDGTRSGTLEITVSNNGPQGVSDLTVFISGGLRRPGGDWGRCDTGTDAAETFYTGAICSIGPLAAGATARLTLPVQSAGDPGPHQLQARTGGRAYPEVVVPVAN